MTPINEMTMDEIFSHIKTRYKSLLIIGCKPDNLVVRAEKGALECDVMGQGDNNELLNMIKIAVTTIGDRNNGYKRN